MAARNIRSVSTPIILGAVSIPLSLALLVGWTMLIAKNLATYGTSALDVWLLVLGAVSFVVIVVVLVLLSAYLAQQIVEVRRQDSFIDSVTHELKSPLASIKLCLETLARAELDPPKQEQLRSMMLSDVDRLTSFIDDVLHASRLTTQSKIGLTITELQLHDLVNATAESVTARHGFDIDRVELEVNKDLRITSDPAALGIVLKNLIDNAIKYSPTDTTVLVSARRDNGKIVVEVQDQGIGIASEHQKSIFSRFYRVQSEDVRARKGTGLGLFVVSALVQNLGGKIEAISDGVGQGTTMRLVLPDLSVSS